MSVTARGRSPCSRAALHHRGVSLVELMVALVVGLVVTAGVMQMFLSNRQSYRIQSDLMEIHENSRFSAQHLARIIRLNGFHGNGVSEWVRGPLSDENFNLRPLSGTDNDVNGSDTVQVTYGGTLDNLVKDCLGRTVASGTQVTNRFSVSAANELVCEISTDAGATWGAPAVLVDGIEAMHILYGEDSDADDSANRYVTANNVSDTDDVVSVRIGLLFRSRNDSVADSIDTRTYDLLDEAMYTDADEPGDKRIRRVVTTTVNLRNHL